MTARTKLLISLSVITLLIGLGLVVFSGNGQIKSDKQADYILTENISPSPSPEASASASFAGKELAEVVKVVDGDTIEVKLSGQNEIKTVRFLGMDTPETVDPRRPVGCFGKEASGETKSLLSNKKVYLEKDISETDKYNRLLRYIYLPVESGQLLFVNDYLVREGFAKILNYPPDIKFKERFFQAEMEAKVNKRGLWSKCPGN